MKKFICCILVVLTVISSVFVFSSCKGDDGTDDSKMSIVCTVFPVYDWVRQLLGTRIDEVDVTMLLDNGVDLHSYQATAADMIKINTCDIFIYVGGESDNWVKDALLGANNSDMIIINLFDVLGDNIKQEELVEGMEGDDHEHDEEDDHEHDGEEEIEYDEHIWLSLKNARVCCNAIAEKLKASDSEHSADYDKNLTDYIQKLDGLNAEYTSDIGGASNKTVVFCDRFPFRYLADDYGLTYYAAFAGCSAETEASFETVIFLAGKIDELGLKNVFVIDGTNNQIADTVIKNTVNKDMTVLTVDSMQSVTSVDVANGVTYISIMRENLNVLKQALN